MRINVCFIFQILIFIRKVSGICHRLGPTEPRPEKQHVCLQGFGYFTFKSPKLEICEVQCLRDKQCKSVNFHQTKEICELNTESEQTVNRSNFQTFQEVVYVDVMEMGEIQGYLGSCMEHTCPAGTICVSAPGGTMARYSCLQQDNCSIAMFCPASSDICVCPMYLVNGPEPVSDDQITASSFFDSFHAPSSARLNAVTTETSTGVWTAEIIDEHQNIQVQFNSLTNVVGVALQGRPINTDHAIHGLDCCYQYVTTYKVFYSSDCVHFLTIMDNNGNDMIFEGNTDQDTIVTSMLPSEVTALCVRINPVTWHEYISLRFDILGCPLRELQ